ncbi:MAG TPA: aminotransferase class I/II-fold pyridoxal phosphate-dependent enzyme [Polyangiaceae bacterium]|nr:aminotransferase class I/II-fold pyridoxal phosphate-dependent enzyme [Polyangiaceae bacterium]
MLLRPFALERFFAKYEFSVRHVLCASDCRTRTIGDLAKLEPDLLERIASLRLGYVDSRGTPSLRAVIASMYTAISPDEVLVFSGAQEAILWFYFATLAEGDEVVVHAPGYASHQEIPKALGAGVIRWFGDPANGDRLDVGELRDLVTPRTRAIIVNSPHNPTGYSMPRADFDAMHALAVERGIAIFSDEVFRESEHDARDRLPAACDVSSTAVSLGVTSKTYGLAGLRVGWIATKDRALYEKLASLKDYSTICNGAPNELLAEVAMKHRDVLANENVALIRRNLDLLDAFFARHADLFAWRRPKAGPVTFVGLKRGDVDTFCDELVRETGVLLMPGTLFDDPHNRFRIGFGRADLPEALAALETFVEARGAGAHH